MGKSEHLQRIEIVMKMLQDRGAQPLDLVEIALLKRKIGLPLQARQIQLHAEAPFQ
jgi:hypothetical protein